MENSLSPLDSHLFSSYYGSLLPLHYKLTNLNMLLMMCSAVSSQKLGEGVTMEIKSNATKYSQSITETKATPESDQFVKELFDGYAPTQAFCSE